MKKSYLPLIITTLTITLIAIFSVSVFAQPGWQGKMGRGWGMGWNGCPVYSGTANNLSDEDLDKVNKQIETFFKETGDLRQSIMAKNLELRAELAKKKPDTKKAIGLQKELSRLESELEQKRVAHIIEMRKINPEAGTGYGAGRCYGKGRGRGGYGGGYCWR